MKTEGPFSTMTHVVVWNDIGTKGHFTVVYSVAKPSASLQIIWSEAEGDLVVIENSIWLA